MFSKVENKSQWKALLEKTLFKTFFHALEWEEFLEKEFSWMKFERYIWRDELLLSIARCRMFGREKLVSHPFCEYGGPLPLKEQVDLEGFIQDFKKEFGEKARMKFHPHILRFHNSPQPPLASRRGTISTFLVEDFSKKTSKDLWQGFRKTLRQEIKKAAAAGITVAECSDEKEIRHFYGLYLDTVKRHNNIPLPFSAAEFLASPRRRREEASSSLFVAKQGKKVVGGSIFLFYKPFLHYFISASDQRLRSLNTGHAILWHVMQVYVGRRTSHIYDYFDLGGTRKGSALEIFKRGWGAKEYPIYELGGRDAFPKDSLLRKAWSLLPNQVIARLAPFALWMKV